MRTVIAIAAVGLLLLLCAIQNSHAGASNAAPQGDYLQLRAEAEQAYAQGSYSRAHDLYSRVDQKNLNETERRWVSFRVADTSWRAQAATETSDNTKFEEAQKQLEELIHTNDKQDERDLVWAEAHESLGDFFWTRRNQTNW